MDPQLPTPWTIGISPFDRRERRGTRGEAARLKLRSRQHGLDLDRLFKTLLRAYYKGVHSVSDHQDTT